MSGNLCRCGAYAGITEAVLEVQTRSAEAGQRNAA
jgi:xanthine dehydrogenase YagT iron-sulfur-binding subunit